MPKIARTALFVLLLATTAGCSGSSETSDQADPRPAQLALTDIADPAIDGVIENNLLLDQVCARNFGAAALSGDVTVGLVADEASIEEEVDVHAAHQALLAATRCFDTNTSVLESAQGDAADQITAMVSQGVDIVVTVGQDFEAATAAAAANADDVKFLGVGQSNADGLGNYVTLAFEENQVGFLAGSAAALASETGTVAIVAGPDTEASQTDTVAGFVAGAQSVSPTTRVLEIHTGDQADSSNGTHQATEAAMAGADVVFVADGDTAAEAIVEAATLGAQVIGNNRDQYHSAFDGGAGVDSGQLITSILKRVDLGVFTVVAAMAAGEVEGGQLTLNVANGGIAYAPFHEADVSAEQATRLEEARLELATGQ